MAMGKLTRQSRKAPVSKNIKKYVAKAILSNEETKFAHLSVVAQRAISVGVNYPILNVPQGNTQLNRIGNQLRCTGYHYDILLEANVNSAVTEPLMYKALVRIIIYIPKDPTNTLSGLNYADMPDMDKYTILSDDMRVVNFSNGAKRLKISKKFKRPRIQQYDTTTSTSCIKFNPSMYVVSDINATANLETPVINIQGRCYYKDS